MPNTSQAQLWTRKRYDYGLYVVTAMGDSAALNHAWYMQNKQPAMPSFDTCWQWTEFDWEFVPQTAKATPFNRIVGEGSALPFSSVDAHHVEMEGFQGSPGTLKETSGQHSDDSFASQILDNQWSWMAKHGTFGLNWPKLPKLLTDSWKWLISKIFLRPTNVETDKADLWRTDFSQLTNSTIGWGFPYYPSTLNAFMSASSYIVGDPANPTAMKWPDKSALPNAISVNLINAPKGTTPLIPYDFGSGTYSSPPNPDSTFVPVNLAAKPQIDYKGVNVPENLWQFFYTSDQQTQISPGAGFPGRQSFVYASGGSSVYDPANAFYDYTIAWTPTRVAFYILPAGQGANIDGQTPVYVLDKTTSPTVADLGPAFPGAKQTFWYQDYDAAVQLGQVFMSFQLWNMGADSFSGTQTGNGAMYVRECAIYPYSGSGSGNHRSDFDSKATLSFDFSGFSSNSQCLQEISRSFSIVNGAAAALYYSADNVEWVSKTPADVQGALKLKSIYTDGAEAEWYGLGPAGWTTGASVDLKQQVVAKIEAATLGSGQMITFACASSGEDADSFMVQGATSTNPVKAWLTIKNPHGGYEAKAELSFTSDSGHSGPSWSIGAPTPTNSQTTQKIANELFKDLGTQGSGSTISPQLFTGS